MTRRQANPIFPVVHNSVSTNGEGGSHFDARSMKTEWKDGNRKMHSVIHPNLSFYAIHVNDATMTNDNTKIKNKCQQYYTYSCFVNYVH